MSIPTDRDLLINAAGNLLNAANGFEPLNPTLARRLAAAVINDKSFGVDYISRIGVIADSLATPAPEQATQPQQADGRDAQVAKDAIFLQIKLIREYVRAVERIAFEMPAPNRFTPRLVQASIQIGYAINAILSTEKATAGGGGV